MLSRKSYEQNPHDIEPAMFLATSYDKASEAWTKQSPSKSVCVLLLTAGNDSCC
jgi:U3 small nucleolar RNA-associated protein 22